MERLTTLQARVASISALLNVVRSMRSLAAVRMQQVGESLAGARAYADTIALALGDALALMSPQEPRKVGDRSSGCGLLLFCSEHGFAGALNDVLLDHAERVLQQGDWLFLCGSRGATLANERDLKPAWTLPMTVHHLGVPATAQQIAAELYRRFEDGQFARLDMIFARMYALGRWSIETRSLLPLDTRTFSQRHGDITPLYNLPPYRLVEKLVEEYFFAVLSLGVTEALAAENAARMTAMSAAHENIERKLEELRHKECQLRQEEITIELLDIISGSEAAFRGRP